LPAGEPNTKLLRIRLHDPARGVAKGQGRCCTTATSSSLRGDRTDCPQPTRRRGTSRVARLIQDTTEGASYGMPSSCQATPPVPGLSLGGIVDAALGQSRRQVSARRNVCGPAAGTLLSW
jgi:hypothetical protein